MTALTFREGNGYHGPANDNHPHFDVSGAADGYVIRNSRGHVVRSCATLSNAARALAELRGAS
jgi:hypothetical protein